MWQEVARFGMPVRETFSNTTSWLVANEYDKVAVMQIASQLCLGTFQHCLGTFIVFLVESFSEMDVFRQLSDYVFGVFENTKSMRVKFLFKIFKI